MSKLNKIPWLRILAESVAIVASILVAFSIDAWWDQRQLRNAEVDQLARVVAELQANATSIEERLDVLSAASDAAVTLISWLGPEPAIVSQDEFVRTFIAMFSVGTFAIPRNALDDYLSAARLDTDFGVGLRDAIVSWYSMVDRFEGQHSLMRQAHAELSSYLIDAVPTLRIDGVNSAMAGVSETRFPFDHLGLMSDPRFESRVSTYLIRLKFLASSRDGLHAQQAQVIDLIDSTVGQ